MCHQPPGTDVCITFKSSLMRGRFMHPRREYSEARAPFCFVPGTRRVSVLSGPGPRWRLLLCSRCFCRVVPRSGSRLRFPWSPCDAPFEGSRPAPMLRRSASKGSALLCPIMSQHGNRGYLSFVEYSAVRGGPSLRPSTGLKLGARRSYK